MLSGNYTFVDVETTGLSPTRDRIIEVGILRVENGTVIAEYNSLLNPEVAVPRFITTLTGLTYDHLKNAPTFAGIKDRVLPLFENSILVAHNAPFDYRFLYQALKRCGHKFRTRRLCTLQLTQALLPGQQHNLGAVARQFGLAHEGQHRALVDARLTLGILNYLSDHLDPLTLQRAMRRIMQHPSTPRRVPEKQLALLPDSPGVYTFYDEKNVPLYIGKSIHLKKRVADHFREARDSGKEARLAELTSRVAVETTAGELGALIRESARVKQTLPIYNQKLRRTRQLVIARLVIDDKGYKRVVFEQTKHIDPDIMDQVVGVYRSRDQAKKHLRQLSKDHQLCDKLLGLETGPGPCFGSQIGLCFGACTGLEPATNYNQRLGETFEASRLRAWPYPGPIVITEENESTGQHEEHFVDGWCYLGSHCRAKGKRARTTWLDGSFDIDTYRLLCRFLNKTENAAHIRILEAGELKALPQRQAA